MKRSPVAWADHAAPAEQSPGQATPGRTRTLSPERDASRRSLVVRGLIFAALALGFVLVSGDAAWACHWGGVGCGEPEEAPFDPQATASIADDRIDAHSDVTVGWTQEEHEQFVMEIVIDGPPEADIDLDAPAEDEQIGELAIVAIVQGEQADIPGKIWDRNDGVNWPDPDGVYLWELEINATTGDFFVDAFVDVNAGHFHLETTVPEDLREQAELLDASTLSVDSTLFGEVGAGPFLTNPSDPGTYAYDMFLRGWDDPDNNLEPGEANISASVEIVNRTPTTVDIDPADATVRVGNDHTLTATVLDQEDDPITTATVDFEAAGTNPGLKCDDVPTDADGEAQCTYSGANVGEDTVTATGTNNGESASGTATVDWVTVGSVDLEPDNATVRVDSQHEVTGAVLDNQGNPIEGVTVNFDVTGANPTSGSDVSDADGRVAFSYVGSNPGDDTIAATIPDSDATDSVAAHWIEPTTLDLTPPTADLVEGEQHTVTALVLDQDGNPMAGETVDFSVSGANPDSGSDVTDADGNATFSYTGDNPGSDTIEATVAGTPASDTATAQWAEAVPTTLTLSPADAERSVGQTHTLTAEVRDQLDRPLEGETVAFEVTAGPHSNESGSDVTDADGNATFSYVGTDPGVDTIEATVGSLVETATVEWIDQVPTTLNVTLEHDNGIVSYGYPQHHTATVTAEVLDQDEEPMAGIDVLIEIADGPNATGEFDEVVVTGADGVATWDYSGKVSNGEGVDTVRVSVVNSDLVEERTMEWRWHPCDNPDAIYLGLPIGGGIDQDYTVQGNRVRMTVCWGNPHQHDE